ncbi:LPS-assembly lipoprotein LptE [Polaromonas eurypsychrophila]|uniref:LPS-assembly lipoprotein LptE n=1 Tax=Polaromonas eurypsychrophila TaxID=1614635 RepID=A0A916S7N3_9BURK|nr:LPS assembly lipoprotein LptE [Polaromonas eurypsychrophila]GGA88574.1 LPS-assembly lipoprotein LptE [Polaromonas eurypsychrophila]
MHRRVFLLAAMAVAGLSACGFALRQAPNYAFKTLFNTAAEGSTLGTEFNRNLEAGGTVKVIRDPRLIDQADVIFDVLVDQREKTVVGVNASGQVREFQLRTRFNFQLRTLAGKRLIPPTEILIQRDISFNESAVLAKETEEQLLYRDMQSDIVQQVLRRLAALKEL